MTSKFSMPQTDFMRHTCFDLCERRLDALEAKNKSHQWRHLKDKINKKKNKGRKQKKATSSITLVCYLNGTYFLVCNYILEEKLFEKSVFPVYRFVYFCLQSLLMMSRKIKTTESI